MYESLVSMQYRLPADSIGSMQTV
uniref:Uncharacterized protein n=1 Tax=Moniliophthora roreri TaxID=221103 RepID=A0A0W0GBD4_MONRR